MHSWESQQILLHKTVIKYITGLAEHSLCLQTDTRKRKINAKQFQSDMYARDKRSSVICTVSRLCETLRIQKDLQKIRGQVRHCRNLEGWTSSRDQERRKRDTRVRLEPLQEGILVHMTARKHSIGLQRLRRNKQTKSLSTQFLMNQLKVTDSICPWATGCLPLRQCYLQFWQFVPVNFSVVWKCL